MTTYVFGLDIGGTQLRAAIAADTGDVIDLRRTETDPGQGPEAAVATLVSMMDELATAQGIRVEDADAIGAGLPGPTDPEEGLLFNPPHLPLWRNVRFAQMLEDATGVPAHVRNDAQLAAFGEFRRGAGRGSRHMLYVTVSTGIGGGIVIDGRLYGGAAGTAGEVGHVVIDANGPACSCGARGCIESLASGTAMARIAAGRIADGEASTLEGVEEVTGAAVAAAAAKGDALALSVVNRAGHLLGLALGGLLNTLAPEVLVLGGGAMASGPAFLEPMDRAMRFQAFESTMAHVRVEMAELKDPGLTGAVEWAREFLPGRAQATLDEIDR
ncbi:MAG TPA: ROK family protein [Candidatus Dormibacteraeota bacterium]|jgi:glucokinase|nr:ROK family protein [Candidatus Dormibacteraeota bacterium]